MSSQQDDTPRLYWRNAQTDSRLLNDATISLQKPVVAAGDRYPENQEAKIYYINRVLSTFDSSRLRFGGALHVEQVISLDVSEDTGAKRRPRAYCTDSVHLTAPATRQCHTFYFSDEFDNTSGMLNVTRFANVTVKAGIGGSGIETKAIAAIDPVILARLLTPWGEKDESLSDYLSETIVGEKPTYSYLDPIAEATWNYLKLRGLAPERPPKGWKVEFSPSSATVDEGQEANFNIHILSEEPFSVAMAIDVYDMAEPSLSSASEIFVYTKNEYGIEEIRPLGDDDVPPELRQPRADNPFQ